MTTAPYAKLRANIAGAGNASGVLTGAAGATCQLSQDPAGLGSSFKYEITDYPEGWALPSGWTDVSGVYTYQGLTPPVFNLPALPLWGKLTPKLTVNNGDPGTSGLPKTQFVDESTVISTADPSGNGFEDIAYGEKNQWDARRKWMGPHKRNIRRMAKQALPDYTSVADGYVLSLVGGVPTWVPGTPTFSGDFAAHFNSYSGLTVRAFYRGDLGVTGTTGTGKSAWANQSGDFSNMSPATGATNGIGAVGAGLNSKASLLTNAIAAGTATQAGQYTAPSAPAPATTNNHIYAIERYLVTPGASSFGYWHDAGSNNSIFAQAGQTSPAANTIIYTGSPGALATGVVINQWYRLRASRIGGSDVLRIGAHEPTPVATSNTAPGLTRTWGCSTGMIAAGSCGAIESLLLLYVEGPLATFLTAAAAADPLARAFWSTAIEI